MANANRDLTGLGEIQALQGQIALRRLDFVLAAKPILSAEQFQKFIDLMAERGFGRVRGTGSPVASSGWGLAHL